MPKYSDPAEQNLLLNRSIQAIARLSNVDSDPDEALDSILGEVLAAIPADTVAIALKNPDSDLFDVSSRNRSGIPAEPTELPPGVGVTGWVALHGEALSIPDLNCDSRFLGLVPESRAEIAAPMRTGGAITGVISASAHAPRRFTDQDLAGLAKLAAEAARVFDLLWTLRQLKTKASQLESLIATGSTLISSHNTDAILHHIVSEARSLAQCDVCAIFHVDPRHNTLVLQASSNAPDYDGGRHTIDLDESALAVTIQRNRQLEIHSLPRSGELHQLPNQPPNELVSLLCTPLSLEGKVIGVLNAYSSAPHRFNNDEKKIFAALADLGTVAIQNSNLYARIFTTEERLRKNERLTTLGMLSAEIAHEIRNPLTVIRLLFDSLEIPFAAGDPRVEDTRIIREKLDHLEAIVAKVLSFGGSQSEVRSQLPLDSIVAETLQLVRLKLEQQNITIEHTVCDPGPRVGANKGQIQQVLLNLLLNSIAAMPNGGHIQICSQRVETDGQLIAKLRISDNGGGIPATVQPYIFESFLSATQDGTGLGLAISKRILKSHNGDITLINSGPRGTTFEIQIPCWQPAP